jgi:hypothetical protein
VKIDVEGGEYEVLRGGSKLFAEERPLLIAEIHHQGAAERITSWLIEYHYCAQWKIPDENFPRQLFAWPIEKQWTQMSGRPGMPALIPFSSTLNFEAKRSVPHEQFGIF